MMLSTLAISALHGIADWPPLGLLLAQASDSGGPSPSAQWAIVGFAIILGLLLTLSPSRRTYEVKKPKDE